MVLVAVDAAFLGGRVDLIGLRVGVPRHPQTRRRSWSASHGVGFVLHRLLRGSAAPQHCQISRAETRQSRHFIDGKLCILSKCKNSYATVRVAGA